MQGEIFTIALWKFIMAAKFTQKTNVTEECNTGTANFLYE
jgi:hypothetical protein